MKITIYYEYNQYIVVIEETNSRTHVYYFNHCSSVNEFIEGLARSYSYENYSAKIV